MTRISIKDIARAAGVSHSTVSRSLSDSPLVNPATKARIQQLAREMGYTPNAAARSLVMGQSRTVGVVVTTIADPFIAEVVQGIESTAYEHGYTVILASSNSDSSRELATVEMLRSKRVDSVIVTASRVGALYQEHLERIGAPVVVINNHSEQSGRYLFSVTVDNEHGGDLATRHLIELGHSRIAYVCGPANHSSNTGRLAGYRQALTQAGLPFDAALVVPGDGRVDGGEQAWPLLAALADRPTAVFCYNDMTAIGLLRSTRAAGLAVPRDLSIVGFDDISLASFVSPALTTVAQPQFEMGQQAMHMALTLMKHAAPEAPVSDRVISDGAIFDGAIANGAICDVVIKGKLIVRESSDVPRTFPIVS